MSKRSKQVPRFSGGPNSKNARQEAEEPKTVKFRRNNQVIEDSDFNFGTDDQRAEKQHFVNEKVSLVQYRGGSKLRGVVGDVVWYPK